MSGKDSPAPIRLSRHITDDDRRLAARVVLSNSHSASEARALLEMLDLDLDPTAVRPTQEAITA